MAFGLFGLSALGSGLVDQLSQNDIDAMNKLKLQDEQSTLEAQKYAGTILQNNPEIAARVLGGGDLSGLGGFPGMGGGQPQYPPQQPPYQPPSQQPMAPQPGQPSMPMQPPPQQAALQPGAGSNLTGPNTVSYSPQPPTNPDPRIRGLQMIAAGQGTPWPGTSELAGVPQDVLQRLQTQQHQPWLGPNGAPVGPAANAPRPAPPPGMDPNAPRPMPPQQAAVPQQRPQQPPQQDAGYGGGQFPARGIDLQSAIARIQAKQPNIKPEVMFKTLTLLQKALNPESRLQLQQLGMILRDRRDQERIDLQKQRYTSGLFDPETVHTMAEQALAGDKSVFANLGRGISGPQNIVQVREEMNRMMRERGYSGSDIAAANANFQAQSRAASATATRESNIAGAIAELDRTIPILEQTSKNLPRGQVVPWNRLVQMVQSGTSDPRYSQFITSIQAVRTAYAMAMNRGARVPTVDAMKRADEILGQATSHESLMAQVDILNQEAQAARDAPAFVYDQIMGRISGRGSSQPLGQRGTGTQQIPAGGGGAAMPPPQALKQLQEGVVTTFGNGQKWTLQNGQPQQVQ